MRLVLDHVGRLPIMEALHENTPLVKDYLRNYSDTETQIIRHHIAEARRALDWLEVQLDEIPENEKVVPLSGRRKRRDG